jgi:hypothetical protein
MSSQSGGPLYDIEGETPAFTEFGIETLREIIGVLARKAD